MDGHFAQSPLHNTFSSQFIMSRQASQCLSITMAPSISSCFPFLRLPAEVRVLIYRYLIPGLPISTWWGPHRPFPLRQDGEPCSPAISEQTAPYIKRWCENGTVRTYRATIEQQGIHFLGGFIPPYTPLPSTFRAITSMELYMSLDRGPAHSTPLEIRAIDGDITWIQPFGFEERVKALTDCFSSSEQGGGGNLKRLYLQLSVSVPFCGRFKKRPDELRTALRWNLDPFREKIRGLAEFRFKIRTIDYINRVWSVIFGEELAEIMSVIQDFVDEMRREMMLPKIPQE